MNGLKLCLPYTGPLKHADTQNSTVIMPYTTEAGI